MKKLLILTAATLCAFSVSCAPKKAAAVQDPYAGLTIVTEWEQGPGIEAFADYLYNTGDVFGDSELDLSAHSFVNNEKGTVIFITDDDRKVIASLEIPAGDVKRYEQGILFTEGVYENFDPAKGADNAKNPNYVIIRTFDTQYREFNTDVDKAWRYNPQIQAFEEVPVEGLAYSCYGNDWM